VNSLPKTVTRQRRGGCARVQHANHSATEPAQREISCTDSIKSCP